MPIVPKPRKRTIVPKPRKRKRDLLAPSRGLSEMIAHKNARVPDAIKSSTAPLPKPPSEGASLKQVLKYIDAVGKWKQNNPSMTKAMARRAERLDKEDVKSKKKSGGKVKR